MRTVEPRRSAAPWSRVGRLPGPRWTKLKAAEIGALLGGFAGRSLDWQALLGSYSVSALIIAGIGSIVALEIGLVVTRKSW